MHKKGQCWNSNLEIWRTLENPQPWELMVILPLSITNGAMMINPCCPFWQEHSIDPKEGRVKSSFCSPEVTVLRHFCAIKAQLRSYGSDKYWCILWWSDGYIVLSPCAESAGISMFFIEEPHFLGKSVISPAGKGIGVKLQSSGMDTVRGPCRNCNGSRDSGA